MRRSLPKTQLARLVVAAAMRSVAMVMPVPDPAPMSMDPHPVTMLMAMAPARVMWMAMMAGMRLGVRHRDGHAQRESAHGKDGCCKDALHDCFLPRYGWQTEGRPALLYNAPLRQFRLTAITFRWKSGAKKLSGP